MSIKPGTYRARAVDARWGKSGEGNEELAIQFELLDDPDHQKITAYKYFTSKALEYTLKDLRVCGWQGDDLADLTTIFEKEVSLVVDDEEYKGKVRTKVKYINEPGGIALVDPMSAADVAGFADRMKARIRISEAGKRPAEPVKKPAPAGDRPPF